VQLISFGRQYRACARATTDRCACGGSLSTSSDRANGGTNPGSATDHLCVTLFRIASDSDIRLSLNGDGLAIVFHRSQNQLELGQTFYAARFLNVHDATVNDGAFLESGKTINDDILAQAGAELISG
jgi:hypothetical protein